MLNFIKEFCEKYNIDFKFIKFLFVGSINAAFGYSVFALLLFLKFHYSLAVLLSTILGILFNFKTTGYIVFKNSDNKLIFRFFGVYAITYILNIICLKMFNMFNFNLYLAGFILLLPTAIVSFFLMKKFVFNKNLVDNL